MGEYNSSLTRVQPVFDALQRLPVSEWLLDLWEMASARRPNALPPPAAVGAVRPGPCYERALPPSPAFLRWMMQNPQRLNVLPGPDYGAQAGGAASEKRAQLFGPDPRLRETVQAEALKEIDESGGAGSGQKWWAFEGFTHVDACFETEQCLLLFEGKRKEAVSPSTRWLKSRNQLWRNVEVAGQQANGRLFGIIVAVESEADGRRALADAAESRDGSYPHLTQDQREALDRHLLGFVVWEEIVSRFSLPREVLLETLEPGGEAASK